jgi:hypothetical protein
MRLARPPESARAARLETRDLDLDDVFLDALEAVVLATLRRIGDDPQARLRFFRRILAVAQGVAAEGAARPDPRGNFSSETARRP